MSLKMRFPTLSLLVFMLLAGCGFNPKNSGVRIPPPSDRGTVECLYPDAGCHAAEGTWTDTWSEAVHANGDNSPSFGYTTDTCIECHNPIEDGRNDSAFLFTTGFLPGPPERPIVGCEACHGPGMDHYAYAHADTADGTPPTLHPGYDPALGDTHYTPDPGTVSNTFANVYHLQSCGPCHSPDQHAGGAASDNRLANQYPEWYGGDGTGFVVDDGHSDSLVVETAQGFMTSTIRGVPCVTCHTVEGFVTFYTMGDTSWSTSQTMIDRLVAETGDTDISDPRLIPGNASLPQVSCVSCHPSHDPSNLLRADVLDFGSAVGDTTRRATLCMICHNVRGLQSDVGSGQSGIDGLETPRHPQKELFQGVKNAANDELRGVETLPGFTGLDSAHAGTDNIPDGCTGCHYVTVTDVSIKESPLRATTGHKFLPRLENCLESCHQIDDFLLEDGSAASFEDSTIASFDFGSIYYSTISQPGADYDGDGQVEPFQAEISGMLKELKDALTAAGVLFDKSQGLFDLTQMASRTATERAAAYNYDFVVEDGSLGYHNPKYVVNLLAASISAVNVP